MAHDGEARITSAVPGRWQPERLAPEVRRMAEAAALQAGLPLSEWLRRVVRAASAIERVAPKRGLSAAAQKALAALAEALKPGNYPPLDEARAYLRLMQEFGLTAADIAGALARPREHIERALLLLRLPETVRRMIERRMLSAEDAYALIEARDPETLAKAVRALGNARDQMQGGGAHDGKATA
jgi:hypothetical protein